MKKKLLLVGVAAMGLLAVGVGATSTFAWFKSSETATAVKKSDNLDSIVVTEHVATVGGIEVPLTVTLESELSTPANLLYAHFVASSGSKDLEGGYITSSGSFVSVPEANIGTVFGSASYVLYSTLKVTIAIDQTAKRTDTDHTSENRWADTDETPDGVIDTYFFDGIGYSATQIVSSLASSTIDVGFKATGRGCLFETKAASGDENYVATDTAASGDGYHYCHLGVALTGLSLSSNRVLTSTSGAGSTSETIFYYINGNTGESNAPGSAEDVRSVTFNNIFSVKITAAGDTTAKAS